MKRIVQYGAGNIGRGFIAQVFSEAGYEVIFVDVNTELVDLINTHKSYPINIVSNDSEREVIVKNVSCINGMISENVIEAISECDIMATAVGVNILPRIVPNIAEGIKRRMEKGGRPLNIILCENLIDADKLMYKMISERLNDDEKKFLDSSVGLIEASIGRMVPRVPEEKLQGSKLRIFTEEYKQLLVNKDAFKGEIPKIENLIAFSPFKFCIYRKIFIHNLGHAMAAFLGSLSGYKYIWEAIGNPKIRVLTKKAMKESALALSKKFSIPITEIDEHINDLLIRFANVPLADTVERVGFDAKRKLSAKDRFAGAIKLCEQQGITPVYISIGMAAGFLFENENDTGLTEIKQKIKTDGLKSVLNDLCEIKESSPSFQNICNFYNILSDLFAENEG